MLNNKKKLCNAKVVVVIVLVGKTLVAITKKEHVTVVVRHQIKEDGKEEFKNMVEIKTKLFWKHGPFQGTCTMPKCKEPAKHRLYDKWGETLALIKSRCQKHWLKRLEKIKLKKLKNTSYGKKRTNPVQLRSKQRGKKLQRSAKKNERKNAKKHR